MPRGLVKPSTKIGTWTKPACLISIASSTVATAKPLAPALIAALETSTAP